MPSLRHCSHILTFPESNKGNTQDGHIPYFKVPGIKVALITSIYFPLERNWSCDQPHYKEDLKSVLARTDVPDYNSLM